MKMTYLQTPEPQLAIRYNVRRAAISPDMVFPDRYYPFLHTTTVIRRRVTMPRGLSIVSVGKPSEHAPGCFSQSLDPATRDLPEVALHLLNLTHTSRATLAFILQL